MTTKMFWATMLATTCLVPGALHADGPLPTDPNVVAGDITISTPSATQMLLQQSGAYGIVDWGSFSIANGFGVQVQNGSGATLNRVTGNDLSQIMGRLDATGSVFLINQNGIVFGQTGVVNTGGSFVASTLDIANGDFLDGGDSSFVGDQDSYVINLGSISSLGGDVAILAHDVVNAGTLLAPNGTVGLAAGREILMRDAAVADGLFSVRIGGADTSVTDSGTIRAAAAELRANGGNVYALAGNTDSTIAATGVARVNGRVFLTAGAGGQVKVEKAVKATNADGGGGTITVGGGTVDMAGRLDVTGTTGGEVRITSGVATVFTGQILAFGRGSAGGFVEVSGAHLTFGGTVDTGGGTVLIDPNNIEITDFSPLLAGASVLTTTSIIDLLRTGNVIIQTGGSDGEAGTIAITSALSYASGFDLTLLAHGDILAYASVQGGDATGGDVNLIAGWDGTAFDVASFDAAALATQTLFGTNSGAAYSYNGVSTDASGSVFIGEGGNNPGIAVGAFSGATRVYARDLVLLGTSNADSSNGYAQLGYNVSGLGVGVALDGAISVRATGDISLIGGTTGNSAAQIGHIGLNAGSTTATVTDSSAAITVEALGGLTLQGGSASGFAYAMLGNGSLDVFSLTQTGGVRGGNITVNVGGEISLQNDSLTGNQAWIGHASATFDAISGADIDLTAAAFDTSAFGAVGSGGTGTLDIAMLSDDLLGGNVTVTATDSSLNLTGTSAQPSCECASVNTATDLVVQASGDILLDTSFAFSNTGGGNVALAAGANFLNNSGADAFGTMKGRWLIYSTRPDDNIGGIGVLDADFIEYSIAFDPANPTLSPNAGNGLIHTVTPVITIADATMTYGGGLVLPAVTLTVGGVAVDAASYGFTLTDAFIDTEQVPFSASGFANAGTYAAGLASTGAIATPGVTLLTGFTMDAGQLTVDRAVVTGTITGTPTKVYDGNTAAALTVANFLLSGFVSTEGATVNQTVGTYADANVNLSGPLGVSAALLATNFDATGTTDLANYVLPTVVAGTGTINPAPIGGSVTGTPTKVYDGDATAFLTTANFNLTGFVAGQGASVGAATGLYDSANASGLNNVTVTLGIGDIVAGGGTLLSNYTLPTTLTGNGAISQAVLTGSIIGAPTKVYDGNAVATLTNANFLLGGFVTGEGAAVDVGSGISGTYASANAAGTNLVTASLAPGNIVATGSTLLANYVLPTTATGNGVISQAALSGSIIGTPTKVYDGNAVATLTPANFLLSGFIAGEGATVTAPTGTYATANASALNTVTALLAPGDFSPTGATLLANYILPTSVFGNGIITQGVLVAGSVIGTPTKVYDGTNLATLTAANFLLTGFAVGEGATVTKGTGTYASANASGANLVTVTLTAADFAATGSTQLTNYVLPTSVTGLGAISQVVLTGSIIGAPTKVYDGTTAATLTAANYLLGGFIAGEGAIVTLTTGTYASANASATGSVTATLAAGDFAATGATVLANYVLPTTVSGAGVIDRALLSASIIGLPTKAYDGSTLAQLTAANFNLTGFVLGQGATVTQSTGTYATATAGAGNTVTAALSASDFAANSGTLLANYILPTTASGPGLIDLAPPAQPQIPETRGLETFETTPLGQPSGPATGLEVINAETTQRILDEIRAGSAFCKALVHQEYVIDCLSDRLQSVADGLSAVGEYSEVRAALEDAAQKLHALALSNASAELAQTVARASGNRRSSRPLTAVSASAAGSANAQAAAIIAGAELVLLRSSSGSERRSVAFAQVAQVVNSTKVLLRSS